MGVVNEGNHHTPKREHPAIHERNTVLDTSHDTSDVLNPSSAGAETTPNSSSDMSSSWLIRESTSCSLPKCTCCNNSLNSICICNIFDLGRVYTYDYLRMYMYIKLSVRLKLFLSFISQMAKCFEQANIKWNKMIRIIIMCAWFLMFIGNEYNYCTWNLIRIIKGSDNRGSDNRGSTVSLNWSRRSVDLCVKGLANTLCAVCLSRSTVIFLK